MLEQKLEELQRAFADQSARTERMVRNAVDALLQKDETLAHKVIEEDEPECNRMEMVIEGKIVEIFALFCPRAKDMRKVIAIIKANNELERIGDQAVNIAEHALYLIPRRQVKPFLDIPRMADIATEMMRLALDAFLQDKIELAHKVLELDDIVDRLNEQIIRELITYMAADPSTIERSMRLIFITRNLERIGDLAMNLAEEVVFYLTGEDVRHHGNLPEDGEGGDAEA